MYVSHQTSRSSRPRSPVGQRACLIGLLAGLLSASVTQAETAQFEPVADNWISSCSTGCTANNGGMEELRVRSAWWGPQSSREPKNFRSVLAFDVSSFALPAGNISQATLNLYYYGYSQTDPAGRTYEVRRLTNSWDELYSTWQACDNFDTPDPLYWDSYDAGLPGYQPGGGDFDGTVYASEIVPATAGQWMSWDITTLVREWVEGSCDNLGVILQDGAEIESDPGGGTVSRLAKFRSREFGDSAFHPYLEIVFEDDADQDQDGVPDCVDQCPGVDDAIFGPECEAAIPTTSEWGLLVLSLLLLTAGKVYFGGARSRATLPW